MTTAADIIRVARSQLGYVEGTNQYGAGNQTKFWADLDPVMQGNPWCAAFVSWVFKTAGKPLPAMGKPYGFSYCPYGESYARKNGLWDADGQYQPGDVILYGSRLAEHTGIVVSDNGSTVVTIEGNTSSGESGSQTNGGGVYLRHRPHGPWVRGVIATSRLLDKPPASPLPPVLVKPKPAPAKVPAFPGTTRRGSRGAAVRAVQSRLKARGWRVSVDGDFGPGTDAVVRAFQKEKRLGVDGVVGPNTWRALWSATVTK